MKVELKDAKVELEVGGGKPTVFINGKSIPIPREVGVALIFGEDTKLPTPIRPGLAKTTTPETRKTGCQSAASKRKLSASLKKYHAKRRRKEALELKKGTPLKQVVKPKSNSRLNGSSIHVN